MKKTTFRHLVQQNIDYAVANTWIGVQIVTLFLIARMIILRTPTGSEWLMFLTLMVLFMNFRMIKPPVKHRVEEEVTLFRQEQLPIKEGGGGG